MSQKIARAAAKTRMREMAMTLTEFQAQTGVTVQLDADGFRNDTVEELSNDI